MRTRIKKNLCILTAAAVILGGIHRPVAAKEPDTPQQGVERLQSGSVPVPLSEENGVTVSTREEFMDALQQRKSPITVSSLVTIGKDVDTDHRMLPVKIPAGTVIRGTPNGILNCRCPIQLEGDVYFQDIEVTFESSDALGSVPHREIFLAGHSLTFDNVKTFLEGGGGDPGGFGGTEEELLPTVYAGGYTNTQIGENASLTVRNSNSETMFQAVYMGHKAERDNKVPYLGTATVNLDTRVIVRGKVDTSKNSRAEINISGGVNDYARTKEYYGNENTTLTLSQSSIDGAVVEGVGNIVIADKGCLTSTTDTYRNVTLQRGGCLDVNSVGNVLISGDFTGVSDPQEERGILVVKQDGIVTLSGKVTGTTQFQTDNRLFPGSFNIGWPYISANAENAIANNFVLSQKSLDRGYKLNYNKGKWSVVWADQEEEKKIGEINIVSAPTEVNLNKIKETLDGTVPDENVYFEIIWTDTNGNEFSTDEVEELALYESDYIFKIKTEYWESDDPDIQEKTDWGNVLSLMTSEEHPGKYFLQAHDGAKTGEYTFLFCSDYYIDELNTVQDVKGLKDLIKAECNVSFLDKDPEPAKPTITPTAPPTGKPEPTPENPAKPTITPVATPTGKPEPTPENPAKPTVTPTGKPEPTPENPANPTATPTGKPEPTTEPENPAQPTVTPTQNPEQTPPAGGGSSSSTQSPLPTVTPDVIPEPTPDQADMYKSVVVNVSSKPLVYNGKAQKPVVKVTDAAGNIISSENYQLLYQNNVKVGQASVTVIFNGDLNTKITKYFSIVPKNVKGFQLISKSKKFVVKWKRQSVQTTGYEIQFSTNKKFKKKTSKTATVKSNKTISKKFSRKKAGKRYYVRIRTYKTVRVDGKMKKFYSGWSKVKTVK
ncbi:MAG: hypothetical protein HFG35_06530 [Eubacterium sp.]|nr:hypothetical protein [Eubacterium sp.]